MSPITSAPPHVRSYYAATANWHSGHPPLEGDVDCDVCVVGAGYTGLSAALHLAAQGARVVVLEAARVGWAASGRNGGQIVSGYSGELTPIEMREGLGLTRRLWALAEESKELLQDLVHRHRINCDLKQGYLFAACNRRHGREMETLVKVWGRYGYDQLEILDRDATQRYVASERYIGGLFDRGGGHLHPLNYALGLARAAADAGATIHEASKVESIERGTDGVPHVCRTSRGQVRSTHLVLAGNAYLGDLAPELRSHIMPVATYMVATEPLGSERARALIPSDAAVADFNLVVDYCRLSTDHRLLFGSGARYWLGDPHDLKKVLHRRMLHIFPQLGTVGIEYVWGGHVAITMNRLPHLGSLGPTVWFAHGYSGQGVAMATLAGKLITEAIGGHPERLGLYSLITHRKFPGGPIKAPVLALAMAYHRLRDSL